METLAAFLPEIFSAEAAATLLPEAASAVLPEAAAAILPEATAAVLPGATAAIPYFDAAAGWINPTTGSIMSSGDALQALTPLAQAGDPTALSQLTNFTNTTAGLSGISSLAGPSILDSLGKSFTGQGGMNLEKLLGPEGRVKDWWKSLNATQTAGLGLGALGAGKAFGLFKPNTVPDLKSKYNPYPYNPTDWKNYHPSLPYADGGIATIRTIGSSGDPRRNPSPINIPNAPDWQGAQGQPTQQQMASGGIANLGSYSDGGRLLKGPGDGVSDNIPATIAGHQPARLADGEFVVPARIVSEIGNGSTDAGAKRLYAMMDRVQNARRKTTGKDKFAANTRAEKYLPA